MGFVFFDVVFMLFVDINGGSLDVDVEMDDFVVVVVVGKFNFVIRVEVEVVRLVNIILFFDWYDFYMVKRIGNIRKWSRDEVESELLLVLMLEVKCEDKGKGKE